MKKQQTLNEWYQEIKEEEVLPNGLIKIKIPVQGDIPSCSGIENPIDTNPIIANPVSQMLKPEDPVVIKNKETISKSISYLKQLESNMMDLLSISEPYGLNSELRQKKISEANILLSSLGEQISKL